MVSLADLDSEHCFLEPLSYNFFLSLNLELFAYFYTCSQETPEALKSFYKLYQI